MHYPIAYLGLLSALPLGNESYPCEHCKYLVASTIWYVANIGTSGQFYHHLDANFINFK